MGGCPGIWRDPGPGLLKSRGTTNPDISGQESRSVPGRSRCPGILRDANPAWSREAINFFYQE